MCSVDLQGGTEFSITILTPSQLLQFMYLSWNFLKFRISSKSGLSGWGSLMAPLLHLKNFELKRQVICLFPASVGGPQDHRQVWWLSRRTQHTVILMLKIYYNKRIQSKISKGKRHMGRHLKKMSWNFQNPLSLESHKSCLILPKITCDNTNEMFSTRETH